MGELSCVFLKDLCMQRSLKGSKSRVEKCFRHSQVASGFDFSSLYLPTKLVCYVLMLFSERLILYYSQMAADIAQDYTSNRFKSRKRATGLIQYS